MIHKCSECKKDYDDGWGEFNVVEFRRICNSCLTSFMNADQNDFLDGYEGLVRLEFEDAFGKAINDPAS